MESEITAIIVEDEKFENKLINSLFMSELTPFSFDMQQEADEANRHGNTASIKIIYTSGNILSVTVISAEGEVAAIHAKNAETNVFIALPTSKIIEALTKNS